MKQEEFVIINALEDRFKAINKAKLREKGPLEKEGAVLYDEHGDFYLKDKKWQSNFKRRLSLLQNKICIHLPENHKDSKDHDMAMMYVDILQTRLGIDRRYKKSDDSVCTALLDKPPVIKQIDGKYTIHSPQTEKPYEDMVLVADQNDEEGLAAFYSPQWGTYILVDLESGNIPKTKMRKEPFFTLNDAIKEAKKDFKKSFTLRVDKPPVEKDAVYEEYTLLGQYGTYKGTTVRIVRVLPEKESIRISRDKDDSRLISLDDVNFKLRKPDGRFSHFWYIWKQSKGKYGLSIGHPTVGTSKVKALGADKDDIEAFIGQEVSPDQIINLTKDRFYYRPVGELYGAELSEFFSPFYLKTLPDSVWGKTKKEAPKSIKIKVPSSLEVYILGLEERADEKPLDSYDLLFKDVLPYFTREKYGKGESYYIKIQPNDYQGRELLDRYLTHLSNSIDDELEISKAYGGNPKLRSLMRKSMNDATNLSATLNKKIPTSNKQRSDTANWFFSNYEHGKPVGVWTPKKYHSKI